MAHNRTPSSSSPGDIKVLEFKRRLLRALAEPSGPPNMLVDIAQDLYLALLARQDVPFVHNPASDEDTRKDRFAYCVFRDTDLLTAYAKRIIDTRSVAPCEGTFTSVADLLARLQFIAPQVLANLEKR